MTNCDKLIELMKECEKELDYLNLSFSVTEVGNEHKLNLELVDTDSWGNTNIIFTEDNSSLEYLLEGAIDSLIKYKKMCDEADKIYGEGE